MDVCWTWRNLKARPGAGFGSVTVFFKAWSRSRFRSASFWYSNWNNLSFLSFSSFSRFSWMRRFIDSSALCANIAGGATHHGTIERVASSPATAEQTAQTKLRLNLLYCRGKRWSEPFGEGVFKGTARTPRTWTNINQGLSLNANNS